MAEARSRRQRHLLNPDGPQYEAVVDECVLHRLAVPPKVMAAQPRHLIAVIPDRRQITIGVRDSNP